VRLLVSAVAAGAVLVGVAGCDDGTAAAPPPASVEASAVAGAGAGAGADGVGTAVRDAERLLDEIDAELAADDAAGD
jgi:hypothetical protein